jgi:hypothetical protein
MPAESESGHRSTPTSTLSGGQHNGGSEGCLLCCVYVCAVRASKRVIWDMWGLEGLLTIYITFIHAVTHNNATHTHL